MFDYGALLFRELCWGNVGVGFTVSESVEPQKAWLLCFNYGATGLLATQHEPGHLQKKAVTPCIAVIFSVCSKLYITNKWDSQHAEGPEC